MARVDRWLAGTSEHPELTEGGSRFSVELWPPRSEASAVRLEEALRDILPLRPGFVSITYGAGGSTRERTHDLVLRLLGDGETTPMAHLACLAHRRQDLVDVLERYRDAGVENILALRGDPPLESDSPWPEGDLAHALDLVELARSVGDFCIAVAAHPEGHPDAPDLGSDRRLLAAKLRLADLAITQFFFRVEDYLRLLDDLEALGVDKPVIPGIMPITNPRTVSRMAELSGAEVPEKVREAVERAGSDMDEVRRIGVDMACELGEDLLSAGAKSLHLYTMNNARATVAVVERLNLAPPGRG